MKNFLAATAAILISGCISLTVDEPSVCDQQDITFPVPSLSAIPFQYQDGTDCSEYSITLPPISTSTTIDLSSSLSKLDDVAKDLSVNITRLTLDNSQGLLDWVSSVDVQISGVGLPTQDLAHYTMPSSPPSQLSFQVVMSASDAFQYLSAGAATLTITLGSSTLTACQLLQLSSHNTLSSDINLCVSAQGSFSKSL